MKLRRYKNGNLYDLEAKRFITLSHVFEGLQRGEKLVATTARTNHDCSVLVLLQAMVVAVQRGQELPFEPLLEVALKTKPPEVVDEVDQLLGRMLGTHPRR